MAPNDRRARRVFLSHTSELRDLPVDRSYVRAAEDAVARANDVVIDMAYFAPDGHPSADLCIQKVRSADILVLIMGYRYGTPTQGQSGESFVELEFRTATKAGKPRLVFMLDMEMDRLPKGMSHVIDDRQQDFRARLRGQRDLAIAYFDSPDRLELLLFQALTELSGANVAGRSQGDGRSLSWISRIGGSRRMRIESAAAMMAETESVDSQISGVRALAEIATRWPTSAQECIDRLCLRFRSTDRGRMTQKDEIVREEIIEQLEKGFQPLRPGRWKSIVLDLRCAHFTGQSISSCHFDGISLDLSGATFEGKGLSLRRCTFMASEIRLKDLQLLGVSRLDFSQSAFVDCELLGSNLRLVDGTALDFGECLLFGGSFDLAEVQVEGGSIHFNSAVLSVSNSGRAQKSRLINLTRATIRSGSINFANAKLTAGLDPQGAWQVDLNRASPLSQWSINPPMVVDLTGAEIFDGVVDLEAVSLFKGVLRLCDLRMRGGSFRFVRCRLSGGQVDFGGSKISGGEIGFLGGQMTGALETVDDLDATPVWIAEQLESQESLQRALCPKSHIRFARSELSGGRIFLAYIELVGSAQLDLSQCSLSGNARVEFADSSLYRLTVDLWRTGVHHDARILFHPNRPKLLLTTDYGLASFENLVEARPAFGDDEPLPDITDPVVQFRYSQANRFARDIEFGATHDISEIKSNFVPISLRGKRIYWFK